jgi:RNA polymerase sigma factor (sigma-70 family)
MRETQELLQEYADTGSESAFRELVERYIDLVYGTARRLVGGDAHLAEDVTQNVFVHLSRNAGKLCRESMLGGWLHRDTCFVASKTLRSERRRRAREREAVLMNSQTTHSEPNLEELGPALDEAVNLLPGKDRLAILLRFFERMDFRTIGTALDTNEDAARMRVNRALNKLQVILKRRGLMLSVTALATALASQTVSAAPLGLASLVAGNVLAGSAGAGGVSGSLFKIMAMTKMKYGLLTAVVIAGVSTSLVLERKATAMQRGSDLLLRQQSEQLGALSAEKEQLAKLATSLDNTGPQRAELAKLHAEATSLRQQVSRLPDFRNENRRLLARYAQSGTPLQAAEESMAKGSFAKDLVFALISYSMDHNDRFPTNFEETAAFLPPGTKAETNVTAAQFEIVYHGTRSALVDPGETIVVREKDPWVGPGGRWVKVYGFGDGHAQLHSEPDGDFTNYEQQHLPPAQASAR